MLTISKYTQVVKILFIVKQGFSMLTKFLLISRCTNAIRMKSNVLPIQSKDQTGPFWMISNLSFQPGTGSNNMLMRIESAYHGIEHVKISGCDHPDSLLQKASWGLIPVFDDSMTKSDIHLFFEHIIREKHPILTLYLEIDTKTDKSVLTSNSNPVVRFGKLMTSDRLSSLYSGSELCAFIQSKLRFFELASRSHNLRKPVVDPSKFSLKYSWEDIKSELWELDRKDRCLLKRGKFSLYLTKFQGLVCIPQEIGRLRARTFEEIGEGSGSPIDLDAFDETYYQLFLVDTDAKGIVGGYRIGAGDELIRAFGFSGFYTHTLYEITDSMKDLLTSSIELGRSFVVQSHQKMKMPLFLLWNGILSFIQNNEAYKYIIGNVSISRVYSDISRSLIINYLKKYHFHNEFSVFFRPRQEFFPISEADTLENIVKVFNGELIRLDEFIAEIEPDNYRVPVLIRKYINQNARFIGFNLDPSFSNCVDGLMLLDVDQLPLRTIQLLREK